ncbi:MAG TPA: PAS domain S-box protein [Alphaproteobacteria bacterium]|nr:PAS domain S-box protein [Alphaproteobacteria bacterium]
MRLWPRTLKVRLAFLIAMASLPIIAMLVYGDIVDRQQRLRDVGAQAQRLAGLLGEQQETDIEAARTLLITISRTRAVQADEGCAAFVESLLASFPNLTSLGAVSADGFSYCAPKDQANGIYLLDRPYVRDAIDRREFTTSGYNASRAATAPTLDLAYPIIGSDEAVHGAVVAGFSLGNIAERIGETDPPVGSVVLLVDDRGTILARVPDHLKWAGKSLRGTALAGLIGRPAEATTADGLDGVERSWGVSDIVVGPARLHLLIGLSPAQAFENANRILWLSLAVALLGLSAAVGLGMAGAEAMVLRPLRGLQRRIEYLQRGQHGSEPPAPPQGIREIAALGDSFERLFEALSTREGELRRVSGELERAVLARTRERDRIWQVSEDLLGVGNFEGYFISFNPAWTRLLGWSEDEIRRMHVSELRHPDDAPIGIEGRRRLAEGVPTVRMENRFRCKDGSFRWIYWTMTAERGRIYVIGRDVTADKAAAEALHRAELQAQEAQARLHTVLDQLPVGVFVAEAPSARIIYFNREAVRLHGSSPTAAGIDDYAAHGLIHADGTLFAPEEYPIVRAVTKREILERVRHRLRRPDGRIIHLAISAAPILDADGTVAFGVVSFEDISQELAAEERLLRAQRMEAVGQLTGGVAHDFNNLLTAVMGNIELLGQRLTSDPERKLVDNAMRAATRGALLTNQLLAFSRRQRLEAKPLDLNSLVQGMAGMLHGTLGGLVQVEPRLTPDVWPALADQTQIEMVILNLVLNARDAMPLGGSIVIETENADVRSSEAAEGPPPGSYAAVTVTDSGTGMPPDVLARVFEPFFTTKEPGKGSGLGLPQALGVLKQLGGGIAIRSRPGAGTSVTIYLPRTTERPAASAADRGGLRPTAANRRVLVVDDDQDVRQATVAMLHSLDCWVQEFAGAAEALAWLSGGNAADVALVDFAMPGMNGVDLAERIHGLRPGMAVAIITGYADADRLPAIDWLAGILKKPFSVEELARLVGGGSEERTRIIPLRPSA